VCRRSLSIAFSTVGGRWFRDLRRMESRVWVMSSGELSSRAVVRKVGDVTQACMRWAEKERCSPWPSCSHCDDDEVVDELKREKRSL